MSELVRGLAHLGQDDAVGVIDVSDWPRTIKVVSFRYAHVSSELIVTLMRNSRVWNAYEKRIRTDPVGRRPAGRDQFEAGSLLECPPESHDRLSARLATV